MYVEWGGALSAALGAFDGVESSMINLVGEVQGERYLWVWGLLLCPKSKIEKRSSPLHDLRAGTVARRMS